MGNRLTLFDPRCLCFPVASVGISKVLIYVFQKKVSARCSSSYLEDLRDFGAHVVEGFLGMHYDAEDTVVLRL